MTFFLALSSLLLAATAIGWLVGVNKRLSALGMRVLESEDVEKIVEAANRTAFFESRLAACEEGEKQSQNQLAEHGTKLGELAANLGTTERLAKGNETGFAEVSEKTTSFESRMAACENRAEQGENRLSEQETKVNELATRLEAAEKMLDEHAAGISQADRSVKVAADAIESLEEFQAATEKARNLIVATLNDMRAGVPAEQCPGTEADTAEPEETSQGPEEEREEHESQMGHQAISSEVEASQAAQETRSWKGGFRTT